MKENKKVYLNGQEIPVSKEIYQTHNHPDWNNYDNMRRHGRCSQENWKLCHKDCGHCANLCQGDQLSLEHLQETQGFDIEFLGSDPARIVESMMFVEALLDEADRIVSDGRLILVLIYNNVPVRKSARILGIPRSSYSDRKKRLLHELQKFCKRY